MNFGGLIAGALGGGARAVEDMSSNVIKQNDLQAAADMQEQRTIVGERRRSMLNREEAAAAAAAKLQAEEAGRRSYAKSADEVDKRASEIGMKRDVSTANRVAPSVEDGTMSIIKSRLSAEDQEKFYGVKQAPQSAMVMDKITAARELGADPKLRDDLKGDYKVAVTDEGNQAKAARDERKMDETERNNREDQRLAARRLEGILASKDSSRAEKSEAMLNLNTTVSTQQKIIKDTEERMRLLSKSSPEYASATEEVKQAREISDRASKVIKAKLGGGEAPDTQPKPATPKPAINALPAGAKKIGTSGGKDVYQTPDGKKFISQ